MLMLPQHARLFIHSLSLSNIDLDKEVKLTALHAKPNTQHPSFSLC